MNTKDEITLAAKEYSHNWIVENHDAHNSFLRMALEIAFLSGAGWYQDRTINKMQKELEALKAKAGAV